MEKKAKTVKAHEWTDGGGSVLILRRINKDGTSRGGFKWPDGINVEVECPDWKPDQTCEHGLHGWPWGIGLGEGCDYDIIDDRWLVVAASPSDVIGELEDGEKCKIRKGVKLYDGEFSGAWEMINGGRHRLIEAMASETPGAGSNLAASGEDGNLAASGYGSRLAASGNYSRLAASGACSSLAASGDGSRLSASGAYSNLAASGNYSRLAASGAYSNLAASGTYSRLAASGDGSRLAASGARSSIATCGDNSRLAASGARSSLASSGNDSSLAASGDDSSLTASGDGSRLAASGAKCIVMASGLHCIAKTGPNGAIALVWNDGERYRVAVGYVGEDGIKADTWYMVENGKLVEAKM